MNSRFAIPALIAFSFVFILQSCEDENEFGENETVISRYNEDESHKAGQNCMNCHFQGGSGEGWFNIAGTVYDSLKDTTYPNATIRFYTGPSGSGSLKYTVEVDALGNFFTTEDIDFGDELFTSVEGTSTEEFMISPVSMGECNSCHGNSVERIWAK